MIQFLASRLQRGRAGEDAEGTRRARRSGQEGCFNEAAPVKTRKGRGERRRGPPSRGFNEAAPVKTRKGAIMVSPEQKACTASTRPRR